jgi:hypothetical protein
MTTDSTPSKCWRLFMILARRRSTSSLTTNVLYKRVSHICECPTLYAFRRVLLYFSQNASTQHYPIGATRGPNCSCSRCSQTRPFYKFQRCCTVVRCSVENPVTSLSRTASTVRHSAFKLQTHRNGGINTC